MKILVVGSGGREHALAWKALQSPMADQVYVAPGNAGTALEPGMENVDIAAEDIQTLADFAEEERIGLTIIGPEGPLVAGITDMFRQRGLKCFGPSAAAAQLEGSKAYSKDFLARHKIPTARYANFDQLEPALNYIREQGAPIVVKADGLAAGKGVVVARTVAEAEKAARDMLQQGAFGTAGARIVVEEFLSGEEASFIAMVDGKNILAFATSQDHKARDDGDTGPNTGGMGAYSPAPVVTAEVHRRIMEEVMRPTVDGLVADGTPYTGFLYAGLMIDKHHAPSVVEFNCRFGDPEAQPIMMRMQSDLVELCLAALDQKLDEYEIQFDPRPALGVVLAAGGYPASYAKGKVIRGLHDTDESWQKIFHAGTRLENGRVVTNGGRVLCAVALGEDVSEAQASAYRLVADVDWEDMYCRKDIGYRAVAREKAGR
ncbi:MAG: phosphoribosylamine--glycine ligase [Gammaproteobacteria bacterium]|jgi:phosphoribosylamine--glycine ligase|nr:phosphoribosylamine--glycine ligase [Gammaproteobacteria bacterium]